MTAPAAPPAPFTNPQGRVCFPVAWDRADDLLNRVRGRGILATLVLDPAEHLAHLELGPGADPAEVQAVLGEPAAHPSAERNLALGLPIATATDSTPRPLTGR